MRTTEKPFMKANVHQRRNVSNPGHTSASAATSAMTTADVMRCRFTVYRWYRMLPYLVRECASERGRDDSERQRDARAHC